MTCPITNRYLKNLTKFANKKVTLLFTGGPNSTALLMGLIKVGAARINVVHIVLGENVHDNFGMEQLAAINVANNMGITMRVGKLNGVAEDLRHDVSYKHAMLVQVAPMFTNKDDDYCLMGLGASTMGASFVKTLQRTFHSSGYCTTRQSTKACRLEFPILSVKRSGTITALYALTKELGYDDIPKLLCGCNNRYGDLILNGYHVGCGNCAGCKSLGVDFKRIGVHRDIFAAEPLETITSMYPGPQKLINVIAEDQIETIVITATGHYSHSIATLEKVNDAEVDNSVTNMFVGEWNEGCYIVQKDYKAATHAKSTIAQMADALKQRVVIAATHIVKTLKPKPASLNIDELEHRELASINMKHYNYREVDTCEKPKVSDVPVVSSIARNKPTASTAECIDAFISGRSVAQKVELEAEVTLSNTPQLTEQELETPAVHTPSKLYMLKVGNGAPVVL